jgi:pyruvate dehydrogenase complex dehydrogenase (E1) component
MWAEKWRRRMRKNRSQKKILQRIATRKDNQYSHSRRKGGWCGFVHSIIPFPL